MHVRVKVTRRRSTCYYCKKEIETGKYQIVCTYFMKLKYSEKRWTKEMHFHAIPNCWLKRAIEELKNRPYVENRGRKANYISDETKVKRLKILRRRGSVVHRLGVEMEGEGRPVKILRLTEQLEKLAIEIKEYGGVPDSWG